MKLFNLLFNSELKGTQALFFQGGAAYDENRKSLRFQAGGCVSFETYFNLFSYAKYRKYCGFQSVDVCLEGAGSFLAEFFCRTQEGKSVPLQTVKFTDSYTVRLDISDLPDKGYLFFTLTAESEAELTGGGYLAQTENDNPVKVGLVICTYKRETFVKNNVKRLLAGIAAEPEWGDILHVFVIDNAKTLELPESEYYTVVPNKNLGGSGGFTRGITEVCKDPSFTHFLLMDDDIHFEFETLKRTVYLLRTLSEEYKNATVGGSMLYLDKPTVQHEFGGYFSGTQCLARNSQLDITKAENLVQNENSPLANYNAWWYTCMPVNTVEKHGLPFPLFIKLDDVEYGIRSIENLILMSGICIWHPNLSAKYNGNLEYYIQRNEITVSALHFKAKKLRMSLKMLYSVFIQLTLKRYYCAELVVKAYQDFFKGYRFFMNTDMEILNNQVTDSKPQYYSREDLEYRYHVDIESSLQDLKKQSPKRNLVKRAFLTLENFMPRFLFKNTPTVANANSKAAGPLFLKKMSIHFDETLHQGYVCELDIKRRKKIRRNAFKLMFKILFSYKTIQKDYQANYHKVCSFSEWNKKF